MEENTIFYHGSTISDIKEIRPFVNNHIPENNSLAYFTTNRAYALLYIRDIEINHVTCGVKDDGIVRYDEQFPNQLSILYKGVCGYIYKCDNDDCLEKTSANGIWVSKKPVLVSAAQYIPDVYDEIIKCERDGSVNIIRYETLSKEKKLEFYDMMIRYFYKNDIATYSEKKRQFLIGNFTDAWNYVKSNPEKKQSFLEEWEKKYLSGKKA